MSDDPACLDQAFWALHDDDLLGESTEGVAGDEKKPHPRDGEGLLEGAMPHAPRLAKEFS